jgi:hypothetical protein
MRTRSNGFDVISMIKNFKGDVLPFKLLLKLPA